MLRNGGDKSLAYGAQLYAAAAMVFALPLCRALMGPEEFGLMMVLLVAQAWLQVTDLGFPSALARDLAREGVGNGRAAWQRSVGSLHAPLLAIALGMAICIAVVAWWFAATRGSAMQSLSIIERAIWAAALTVPLRWIAECMRTALYGAEAYGPNGWVVLLSSTLRIFGGVVLLKFTGSGLFGWMLWHALISAVEVIALLTIWRRVIGFEYRAVGLSPYDGLKKHWPIARGIATASFAWLAITQLDKLVLAKALSLHDYGTVAIAAAIPAGLITIAVPIMQLGQPKLVRLYARGASEELAHAYLAMTRMVCAFVFPTAIVCGFFSDQLLAIWFRTTLSADLEQVSRLIPLYSIGATSLVLGAIPYGLANASGALRGTMISASILAVAILVGLSLGAKLGGAYLAVAFWTVTVTAYLVVWPAFVHSKELRGNERAWNLQILRSCAPLLLIAAATHGIVPRDARPATQSIALFGVWLLLQFTAFALAATRFGDRFPNARPLEIARWLREMRQP